jgi:hypothetical protein
VGGKQEEGPMGGKQKEGLMAREAGWKEQVGGKGGRG